MAKAGLVVVGDEVPYEFAAKCAQDHLQTIERCVYASSHSQQMENRKI